MSALALLLAAVGQVLVTRPAEQRLAAAAYAAAIVSLLAALIAQRGARGRLFGQGVLLSTRLVCVLAAAAAQVASLVLLYNDTAPLVVIVGLWLVSLGLAAGAALSGERAVSPKVVWVSRLERWDWPSWVLDAPLTGARLETLALGMLVLIGGLVRLAALDSFPTGVHGDETEFGLIALAVLRGDGPNPFGTAFLGDPALFTYLQAPFIALFGRTIAALRVSAAIAGTLTLLSTYALVRALFGPRSALLATAFLVGAAIHVHFSRMGLNVAEVPLFISLSLLLVWRGQETGRPAWWLTAGMVAGAAVYFHFGARILLLAVALFMFYVLALDPRRWRQWAVQVLLLSLGALMVLSPMLIHLAGQLNRLTEHVEGRLIFGSWERVAAQHGSSELTAVLWGQLKVNLLAFVSWGDASTFFTFTGAPLLNGLTAPLFVLGLAFVVFRLRDLRFGLLFFWFWTIVVAGGALTTDSPQYHRLLPAVPAGLIGAALVLDWAAQTWARLLGPGIQPALGLAAALVPATASAYDANAYFGRYAQGHPWADVTEQARYIATVEPGSQVFVVGRPYIYASHGDTRFLAGEVGAVDLANPSAQLPSPPLQKPLVFVVNQALLDWLPLLEELYPNGSVRSVESSPGRPLFTAYQVPADSSAQPWPAGQGLVGRIMPAVASQPIVERLDRTVVFLEVAALAPEASRPFTANWRGDLLAPRAGRYELELFTDGEATLRVDAQVVVHAEPTPEQPRSYRDTLTLAEGRHPIQIEYGWARGPGFLELLWRPPGGQRALVPPSALRPGPP
ncbi:MAG TPA: glycosyltransferase family 39 protein [Chloroflexota bacterium]|nr:glycosyltransferase family 39 protein [Chloroflexota bacterium]